MENRKNTLMLISITAAVFLFFLFKYNIFSYEDSAYDITVVTKSKYGQSWELICKGAYAAANEYGVNLQILAPDYEKDADAQINLVQAAIDSREDAVIISPISDEKLGEIIDKTISQNIIVTEMVSQSHFNESSSYVGTNHYSAGEEIGAEIISSIGSIGTIAIVSNIERTKDIESRELGLREYIEKNSDISILETNYCSPNEYSASKIAEAVLEKNGNVDAIVGLNEITTLGIAKKIEKLNKKICLIGVDSSDEIINYVDRKVIDKLIVQNYYSIGYLAVKNTIYKLQGKEISSDVFIKTSIITPENLYDSDIQKIVFPLK